MKFRANRLHFANALSLLSSLAGKGLGGLSSTMGTSILSNVAIQALEDNRLRIRVTNLAQWITLDLTVEVDKPGETTVSAKLLVRILKDISAEVVEFSKGARENLNIRGGCSAFKIPGLAADDFPAAPCVSGTEYQFPQSDFFGLIRSVALFRSRDTTRYILNTVLFETAEGQFRAIATDGRRMAFNCLPAQSESAKVVQHLIPNECIDRIITLLGDGPTVSLAFDKTGRYARFAFAPDSSLAGVQGDIHLVSKLTEGSYPDYRRVLSYDKQTFSIVCRQALLDAVTRVELITAEKQRLLKLMFTSTGLHLSAVGVGVGESSETVSIQWPSSHMKETLHMSSTLLGEGIEGICSDEIEVGIIDGASPVIIRSKAEQNFLAVLMPTKVG